MEVLLEPPSGAAPVASPLDADALDGAPAGLTTERLLAEFGDPSASWGLVCLGGIHGNEPAGVRALARIRQRLEKDDTGLRGWFLGLAGNLQALRNRRRFLREDLNRSFTPERLERVRRSAEGLVAEDVELRELDAEIQRILRVRAELPTRFLDLHTTSGPGPAWSVLDDTLRNRAFARGFPMPVVLGLEEQIGGTLAFHLASQGRVAIGVESGQHDDPRAVDRAEAVIWLALDSTGVLEPGSRPEVEHARRLLEDESRDLPDVVEVRYRHGISTEDRFRMADGWVNFQPVRKGELLGTSAAGEVRSPSDGLMLMPLYQAQGDDGFFVTQPVRPVWLRISRVVRRLHFEKVAHWLPGVRRHPSIPGAFRVDRRTARWLALELFHLLGFRRIDEDGTLSTFVRRID